MEIIVKSSSFEEGGMIPRKFTCDGENRSPDLMWQNIPVNTKTIALICEDPDAPAGTWVHWLIFNIPASRKGLPESVPKAKILPDGSKQGVSDFRTIGYGGPCPPGGTHRYYFKVYALDCELPLDAEATKSKLLKAMDGHILAEGQLMGKYKR